MQYRSLTEADLPRCVWLEHYAFSSNPDPGNLARNRLSRFRGLFDGPNQVAQLELLALRLQTGLGEIPAGGIGSVASAPETRRLGYVEALLRHTTNELRATGVPLCLLYPFKRSFYGRYGWATFFERRIYTGSPTLFAHFTPKTGPAGSFHAVDSAASDELDRIYRGALRGRFGIFVRDAAWWDQEILHDWERRPWHAYIWRDEHGVGRSYAIFRLETTNDGRCFEGRELVALDPVARAQLFIFIAGHQDQVTSVRFRAPADAPVNFLFPDPLNCTIQPHFMLRILDLPAAFANYTFPREVVGRLTIAVTDPWIAENHGVFAFEFAGGRCDVTRLAAETHADVRCDIRVLTQLYSRYLRPRTAATFGLLAAPSREGLALLERAFVGLPPFSPDYF